MGRAADYVLRDYENVVRVFIHAPKAYRMKRIMEVYGDTEEEARKSVHRSDGARASYYKNITGNEWSSAHNVDLSIDSSIGIDKCAEIICDYIRISDN